MTIRILHIWNTAGCASILAKFMDRKFSSESWVITRQASDQFGFTVYGETLTSGSKWFVLQAVKRARKYDLIHVHALDKIVPLLKRIYSKKPVVMHYAGSMVRGRWDSRKKYWNKANLLLVSTQDLLVGAPNNAIWLPNPVDTDLFYVRNQNRQMNHAFHFSHDADDLALKFAEEKNLELTIHDRVAKPIPYADLGKVLSSYEYYIDVKRSYSPGARGKLIQVLSKTGLEALACECKVIRWDGDEIKGLPPEHHPNKVVTKLWELYQKVLA